MRKLKALLPLFVLMAMGFAGNAQVKKTTTTKTPAKKITATHPVAKRLATRRTVSTVIKGTKVELSTDSGTMVIVLYDSTPLHRDNFIKLVKQGFYDSLLFHRVIAGFMIQGGDPLSKNAQPGQQLGNGGDDMARIPAEFRTTLFHKRGVLAAARDNNPEKASSACQFYLVQGKVYSDAELNDLEMRMGRKFTPEQRKAYTTVGGTPFLDMNYTVFGEVIKGQEVIDKIASVPKDGADRPLGDVHMKMQLLDPKSH